MVPDRTLGRESSDLKQNLVQATVISLLDFPPMAGLPLCAGCDGFQMLHEIVLFIVPSQGFYYFVVLIIWIIIGSLLELLLWKCLG